MKYLRTNLFALFIALSFLMACGSDDKGDAIECTNAIVTQKFTEQTAALATALIAFSDDPTNADKCNEYLAVLQDYINFLTDYKSCFEELGFELDDNVTWDEAIADAQASLDGSSCPS